MPTASFRPHWTDLSPRSATILLTVMIALIFGAFAVLARAAWMRDSEHATLEASNVAALIAHDIHRNIELYDLSLQGARDAVQVPDVMKAPQPLRDAVLFDRAATAPFLGEITVLAPNGDIVASSRHAETRTNDRDRDYFRIHALRPDFGLFLSRPLTLQAGAEPVIALSRRITRADGSFGGVVVGTLRLEYIHQLFHETKLGRGGTITLFRSDGSFIMREPFMPGLIGLRSVATPILDIAGRSAEGEYEAASTVDGVSRFYHFQRIDSLPLIVSVGLATGDIHAGWWRRALLFGSVIALCGGSIVLLTRQLGRELQRRMEAEAKLLSLVDTDGLTGLANRRCFDHTLANEWLRARHTASPLSLLMIDADHFKAYNDLLGHAQGDELLRQVGRCLAAHGAQPGFLAARYGGEEFALVLPGLDGAAARAIAEAIRLSIADMAIAHPGAPLGQFTISIGCASIVPTLSTRCEALITAADVALYRSKRSGRNTVTLQEADPEKLRLAS